MLRSLTRLPNPLALSTYTSTGPATRRMSSIDDLLKSFADKHSPFYLPPGTRGPADEGELVPNYTVPRPSPDAPAPPPATHLSTPIDYSKPLQTWHGLDGQSWAAERQRILERAAHAGWDPASAVEFPVAWGQMDSFRHLNNAYYASFVETARLSFLSSLSPPLPTSLVSDILSGKNVGFVVKSQNIKYKFPVTHPDSLILLTRPHSISPEAAPSSFKLSHEAWSLKSGRLVATCETENVIYDHNTSSKAQMPDNLRDALRSREAPSSSPSSNGAKL